MLIYIDDLKAAINPSFVTHVTADMMAKPRGKTPAHGYDDMPHVIVRLAHSDQPIIMVCESLDEARDKARALSETCNMVEAAWLRAVAPQPAPVIAATPPAQPDPAIGAPPAVMPQPEPPRVMVGQNKTEFITYLENHGFRFSLTHDPDAEQGAYSLFVGHANPVPALGEENVRAFTSDEAVAAVDAMLQFFYDAVELRDDKTGDDYAILPGFRKALAAALRPPIVPGADSQIAADPAAAP